MSRFFIASDNHVGDTIYITGTDVNHIKNVLRYKENDNISVSDSKGICYECVIEKMLSDEIILKIVSEEKANTELDYEIVLFQGYPKGDKLELIIQKAVELGASKIVPVINERTIVKLEPKKVASKVDRFNKISEAAAKQSGRAFVPEVLAPISFKEALEIAKKLDKVLLPYENADGMLYAKEQLYESVTKHSVGVFIGPEGGFSNAEVTFAKEMGASIISLGSRILRTETAGLCIISNLMMQREFFEEENSK